jgi:small subunit ribosomal protein S21
VWARFSRAWKKHLDGIMEVLFFLLDFPDFIEIRGVNQMKVVVQNNQIEKAIKDLKRKLTKEGFFSEIKERRFYDKPSVQKKKKQAKAAKRRRKRMRRF